MNDTSRSKVVHLLLRGEQSSKDDSAADDYVTEFKSRNLIATTVPVLEFNFINIELLNEYLKNFASELNPNGLIITSPRVVDALHKAIGMLGKDEQMKVVGKVNTDLLFIVGNKSASKCEAKLGLKCNNKSLECGNSSNLAEYIKQICDSFQTTDMITLLYPKGNLSDSLIEDSLEHLDRLKVKSLVVYETSPRNDIGNTIASAIGELDIKSDALTLNLIFFSPSGVKGFMKTDRGNLINQIQQITSSKSIDILYSSIGKTTENAITINEYPVFAVALEPNPASLVDAIQQASSRHLGKA